MQALITHPYPRNLIPQGTLLFTSPGLPQDMINNSGNQASEDTKSQSQVFCSCKTYLNQFNQAELLFPIHYNH